MNENENQNETEIEPNERWRRFARRALPPQFRLRALFAVTAVIAVVLTPYVWNSSELQKQELALQELGEHVKKTTVVDGWVSGIDLGYYPRANGNLNDAPQIDRFIGYLNALPSLEHCVLSQVNIGEAGLSQLAELKHLKSLNLFNTKIGDDELAPLAGLTNLESLNLASTRITDAGLEHLAGMTQLKELNLDAVWTGSNPPTPHITDAGAASLASLHHLETLSLRQSLLTDLAVPELATLSNLRDLDISRTEISAAGAARLQQAIPDCQITRDP